MKRGTKSILFGVHQFIWHPLTVAYAWRKLYGRWPTFYQGIVIFCHDLGYWGKAAMDSADGQTHPEGGAKLAMWLVYMAARLRGRSKDDATVIGLRAYRLSLYHSTHYAQAKGAPVSDLYLPDKACVLYEPMWFYLLRAGLSGELKEYVDNDNHKRWLIGQSEQTSREWLEGYRARIRAKTAAYNYSLPPCECDICRDRQDATTLAFHAIKK